MDLNFTNRKQELKVLEGAWAKKSAQLVVMYGRRRIGKTALLSYFAKQKKVFYWMAYRSTSHDLLKDFSVKLYATLNPDHPVTENFTYGNWQNLFETLGLYAQQKKMGVVIDEFPYLVEADPSLPSILQSVWDTKLTSSKLFLILSGSRLGMIKDSILSPKAPLYGRATGIINLPPIGLNSLKEFFPHFSPVQLIELYGITGGVPKYFEFIQKDKPILKSIENAIRDKTTFLTSESEFLLHEEFRETRIYLALLRALGERRMEMGPLALRCGVPAKNISKYIDELVSLKLVQRTVPVLSDPTKTRKGQYGICDMFLGFYFRFISPWLQEIEQNRFEQVLQHLHQGFSAYLGKNVFEKICQEWLAIQADKKELTFVPERIGSYWDKQVQIDVMAVNSRDQIILAGECKWTNKEMTAEDISSLEQRIKSVQRQYDYTIQLIFFSRSGFSTSAKELAHKKHYRLVGLADLLA